MLYCVMYHYVRDLAYSRYPKMKAMDINLFRRQIAFLKEQFQFVTMEQVLDAIDGHTELPDRAVLLTFDDGYIDCYTYAFPILEEAGIQGTFFIPAKTLVTHELLDVNKLHLILAAADEDALLKDVFERLDFYRARGGEYPDNAILWQKYSGLNRYDTEKISFMKRILQTVLPENVRKSITSDLFERYVGVTEAQMSQELYLTPEQIRVMRRHGMYFGLHGYDHYWLGDLTKKQMQEDISRGLQILSREGVLDSDCWVMSYPYQSYNAEVLSYIRQKGCKAGFTEEVRTANLTKDNPYLLPRFDCNDLPPKNENFLCQ